MSTEHWQRLEQIFAEARRLPREARADFVTRACGPDEALRGAALRLLSADDASGEFMSKSAIDLLAHAVAAEGWRLRPGDRLGPYTILSLLGSGGAGEVWRAKDERLGRDVAVKVLLPHVSHDVDRLRRFADEARTAGALNHSNILTVYDVGEHRGVPFLVSECLDGKSLRERLEAGPMRVAEAIDVALGIARGLAAAHARGIVHRDLKPENTFLRTDGGVKILDFGLAKLQSALQGSDVDSRHTVTGVIVGTAGYMAPEQIRGEQVDARADLFALGAMLYEMLAGRHPFRVAGTFETLHAVLTAEPTDLAAANERVPRPLARIVMRLLEKAPEMRFQSALDLIWALEHVTTASDASPHPAPGPLDASRRSHSPWTRWIAPPLLALTVLIAGWWALSRESGSPAGPPLLRFTVPLPPGTFLGSPPIVSPDSRYIAFVGTGEKFRRLFVHALNSGDATAVSGTEGAGLPFWAPDGGAVGFFLRGNATTSGRLMKAAWPGGAPVKVADAPYPLGGAWSASGAILFGPDVILSGLRRAAGDGSKVEPATVLDTSLGDNSHAWPVFLPDGVHFLYFVRSVDDDRRGVYVGRIDRPASPAGSPLFRSDSSVVYVPSPDQTDGVLLYVANGRIEARRFDHVALTVAADARVLGLSAAGTTLAQPAMVSASNDALVFAETSIPYGSRLEAVNRRGVRLRRWDDAEPQNWPRLSPDGRKLARQRVDQLRNNPDIWVEDLERGSRLRLTTAVDPDIRPVWSPDGRYVAYVSGNLPGRQGTRTLHIVAADATGELRAVPCPREYCEPTDWIPGTRQLVINASDARGRDVWTVSIDQTGESRPLLDAPFAERDARISPNGKWVGYVSEESGHAEVSVRALGGEPKRFVVSVDGGDQPVWRRDGAELFFVSPEGYLHSVPVAWSRGGVPSFGTPLRLDVPRVGFGHWGTQYDVSPDGTSIYLLRENDDQPPREIHVVLGWRALLASPSRQTSGAKSPVE